MRATATPFFGTVIVLLLCTMEANTFWPTWIWAVYGAIGWTTVAATGYYVWFTDDNLPHFLMGFLSPAWASVSLYPRRIWKSLSFKHLPQLPSSSSKLSQYLLLGGPSGQDIVLTFSHRLSSVNSSILIERSKRQTNSLPVPQQCNSVIFNWILHLVLHSRNQRSLRTLILTTTFPTYPDAFFFQRHRFWNFNKDLEHFL